MPTGASANQGEVGTTKRSLPHVSICTLTHNRSAFLPRLLSCIERQTYPLQKIEWLILDDSTIDQKPVQLESKAGLTINYQRLPSKLKLGAKRNLSHRLCKGEIIVYMDDDDYYFPERVEHAVEQLSTSQQPIAGSTYLYIYFCSDDTLWLSGPFGKNHATANTFAMTRAFARETLYDSKASINEEKSFLNNYSTPLQQLDPAKTLICIAHHANTFDKQLMRRNGPSKRMRPIQGQTSEALKQTLASAGFRTIPTRPKQQQPILLVCGPWGSGTSAICALLNAIGIHAQGPFFKTNDPLTPHSYEMAAFQQLITNLVDEATLTRKHSSQIIHKQLIAFNALAFQGEHSNSHKLQLLKSPASCAILPELSSIYPLKLLICLRDFDSIEASRQRRGWPEHFGKAGAEIIYQQLLDFTAKSDVPFRFIRHRDISDAERCLASLKSLANWLQLRPTSKQYQQALDAVSR